MKPEPMIVTAQDRPATWEEVRRATSATPDRVLEFCQQGSFCVVDSDFGGVVRYPAEEFEFFACLSEMNDMSVN